MRQSLPLTAAMTALVLSACGPAEVVVTAEIQIDDPQSGTTVSRALPNLQIDLLPYDRDVVFDSLSRVAETPEPEIPPDVLEAQAVVAAAQQEWRDLEARWSVLRDTLQKLNTELGRYSPAEAQYRLLFRDFQDLEAEYNRVNGQQDRAFARFDSLQRAGLQREQEVRLLRQAWADEAFADVTPILRERIRASGLPMVVDTTDASGTVAFRVKPGQYWLHARYEQPYTELYWNVPVTAQRGEPVQVVLSRANALERPKL